jgi:8-oxo-dGTP pyrophosphatase MutT (NUDIX family)
MQPGGHVELHENPWEAITHEILEEAGYDIDQLSVLQPRLRMTITPETGALPQPMTVRCFRFGDEEHFHTDLTYAFVTTEMPRHGVGEGESADLMWVTSDELAQIHTYDDVREVGLFVLDYLVSEWEAVPLHPTHTQIKSLPESTAE